MHDMVQDWFSIFNRVIADYHIKDDVDQGFINPHMEGTLEYLLYRKCWIDTVQWHFEDMVRDPDIDPVEGMELKRRIDASNQQRTDLVEKIDDYLIDDFNLPEAPPEDATLCTESLAWAIDRLSILALKIYHMDIEVDRAPAGKRDFLRVKQSVLHAQRKDLIGAIAQLIDDVRKGTRYYKVYRQVKMYNDPNLNPVLYKKQKS
jgi:hypothetical protein